MAAHRLTTRKTSDRCSCQSKACYPGTTTESSVEPSRAYAVELDLNRKTSLPAVQESFQFDCSSDSDKVGDLFLEDNGPG